MIEQPIDHSSTCPSRTLNDKYNLSFIPGQGRLSAFGLVIEGARTHRLPHLVSATSDFPIRTIEAVSHNNYFVMHGRTAVIDDKPNRRAHPVLRLWIYTVNREPVDATIEPFDIPGFVNQPDSSPPVEGKLLRTFGDKPFSRGKPPNGCARCSPALNPLSDDAPPPTAFERPIG